VKVRRKNEGLREQVKGLDIKMKGLEKKCGLRYKNKGLREKIGAQLCFPGFSLCRYQGMALAVP
jgi:hypothetical protein